MEIYSTRLELGRKQEQYPDHALTAERNGPDTTGISADQMSSESTFEISFARQAEVLKKKLELKKTELKQLTEEHGVTRNMRKNFEGFMRKVDKLPDGNGEKSFERMAFDHCILRESVLKIRAQGDKVYYGTTFGLTLVTMGNERAAGLFI